MDMVLEQLEAMCMEQGVVAHADDRLTRTLSAPTEELLNAKGTPAPPLSQPASFRMMAIREGYAWGALPTGLHLLSPAFTGPALPPSIC